jgi:L-fuculose-phosphate aldolase
VQEAGVLLKREREEIVAFGNKLLGARLTVGSGGNLSLLRRRRGLVAISPSGVEYPQMTPQDVVVVDRDGCVRQGARAPSSELGIHLALYRRRSDVAAVVHTHSVYATTLACLGWELPAAHYLVAFSGVKVPLAPYATFGTPQLADNVVEAIGDFNAVLMANHGLVAVGPSLARAFTVAEEIEFAARVYFQARCIGTPKILPEAEMQQVAAKFATYGSRQS